MMIKKTDERPAGAVPVPPALVDAARGGDQGAFTELYERTSPMLYRTLCSMVSDEDLVWDILQDSYIRAFRSLDALERSEAFLPWLRRIAVNVASTRLARRPALTFTDLGGEDGREPELPDPNPENQPELALERRETVRVVRSLLGSLSEEQQRVLGMYYYEDMSVREIGETLRIAPGTVKTLLHRGRKRIEAGFLALERPDYADRRPA